MFFFSFLRSCLNRHIDYHRGNYYVDLRDENNENTCFTRAGGIRTLLVELIGK